VAHQVRRPSLLDQVVVITGGSRGLGLLLAHAFARSGALVVLAARDEEELQAAASQLSERGALADTVVADVSDAASAQRLIEETTRRYGRVDVLVNNAGNISVGPVSVQTREDFERALATIFWGTYNTTMAALPQMRERRSGRIVNIASIGGKVSVPHLLPYDVGKFAVVGFSEGLRAELAREGITVTTVCPGLMRTGSPPNASFKGSHEAEYAWFTLGDSLPGISMSARRAARQIVGATRRGRAEVILGVPAHLLVWFHGLAPGLTSDILAAINGVLPAGEPRGAQLEARTGRQAESAITESPLTGLTQRAARDNNQLADQPPDGARRPPAGLPR
jgi:NAD(P)-dependent dehydrogenase (short-subunit alcohol dehydrogenase family)